jgi:hypothetical protein
MSPERSESWWQPPKQFDEPAPPVDGLDNLEDGAVRLHRASWDDPIDDADERDGVLDLDDELEDESDEQDVVEPDDEEELLDRYDDEFLDDLDDSEPDDADDIDTELVDDVIDEDLESDDLDAELDDVTNDIDEAEPDDFDVVDHNEVDDLEDLDEYPTVGTRSFAGWSVPTETVATPVAREGISNRAFALGIVLIVLATILGVAIALSFDSSNDRSKDAPTPTTTARAEVRSETTVRSSTEAACNAEQARLEQAEFDYELGSTNHAYTDVHGLLESKKLDKAPTMLTITNARPANPPTVEWAGHVGKEFLDYEIHPIAGGPCVPTTTPG